MGLYFGADNYEEGIVITVRSGWDTDCNGATVGSILGARF
ncbi:MAG: ADP-ribosylglycohydrolase family protein, partial [Aphanocapsa feldmannii 288cV]